MIQWPESISNHRFFYHYLFWGVVILSYVVDAAELRAFNRELFFQTLVLKNGLLIAIVYLHLRVIIPAFLTAKRWLAYTVSLGLTIVIGAWLINRIECLSWSQINHKTDYQSGLTSQDVSAGNISVEINEYLKILAPVYSRFLLDILTVCRYMVISVLLKFIDDFFKQREQIQIIQHEKTLAELEVLKAQINPHFLFNTLNNLYGLILERSDLAAETVLKLSDIMKYTLTDGNAHRVPLLKDLEHLKNYFDLEKLRLANADHVTFEITGSVKYQLITPLLLLPLVENSFKHGIHSSRENPFLKIEIHVYSNKLTFKSTNPVNGKPSNAQSLQIGLNNVRQRLQLLYPGHHALEIHTDSAFFYVQLSLDLL